MKGDAQALLPLDGGRAGDGGARAAFSGSNSSGGAAPLSRPLPHEGGEDQHWRSGGCHCGAVRFEALLPEVIAAQSCNCSICEKTGFVHIIVPESRFRLTAGADQLSTYSFNTGVARHHFCAVCGIKSFYRPRSNPDGWSVNARCLDDPGSLDIRLEPFDGRNWEAHGASLAHLSQDRSALEAS